MSLYDSLSHFTFNIKSAAGELDMESSWQALEFRWLRLAQGDYKAAEEAAADEPNIWHCLCIFVAFKWIIMRQKKLL